MADPTQIIFNYIFLWRQEEEETEKEEAKRRCGGGGGAKLVAKPATAVPYVTRALTSPIRASGRDATTRSGSRTSASQPQASGPSSSLRTTPVEPSITFVVPVEPVAPKRKASSPMKPRQPPLQLSHHVGNLPTTGSWGGSGDISPLPFKASRLCHTSLLLSGGNSFRRRWAKWTSGSLTRTAHVRCLCTDSFISKLSSTSFISKLSSTSFISKLSSTSFISKLSSTSFINKLSSKRTLTQTLVMSVFGQH